jgi:3-hydroxy-9,10-secoandrosta-1,3,5(10)-triene-9,17-dione monooxygenase
MSSPEQIRDATASDEELVARARSLVPVLAEHAAQTERAGQLAAASAQALRDAGFFALAVPRRFGGLGVSPASGVHEAQWALLGAPVVDERGAVVERGAVLVALQDVAVQRTWDVARMQGTGSDTILVEELFVPNHRILSLPAAIRGAFAGGHPDEPVYDATLSSTMALLQAAPVLGLAQAALARTLERLAGGKPLGASLYAHAVDAPGVQLAVAQAASLVDTATLHAFRVVDDIERGAASGTYLDLPARARVRMDCATVASRSREAVDLMLSAAGSSSFARAEPLQRMWRDIDAASRHAVLSPLLNAEIYGRALLGIEAPVSPMV